MQIFPINFNFSFLQQFFVLAFVQLIELLRIGQVAMTEIPDRALS